MSWLSADSNQDPNAGWAGMPENAVKIAKVSPAGESGLQEQLPMQLQGVLDDKSWYDFAGQVNRQLTKEREGKDKGAGNYLACFCFACLFFLAVPGLYLFDLGPLLGNEFLTELAPVLCMLVCCTICRCTSRVWSNQQQECQEESKKVFQRVAKELNDRNRQVIVEVKEVVTLKGEDEDEKRLDRWVEWTVVGQMPAQQLPFPGSPPLQMMPGLGQPGMMQPGMPGMMQPGMMGTNPANPLLGGGGFEMPQLGMTQPGMMQPGMMQPGLMQPGMPGMMQPGAMQANPVLGGGGFEMPQFGMTQPGMMQPGMMQPGMPGMMQPGTMQGAPGYMGTRM